jgi:cytochrome P450
VRTAKSLLGPIIQDLLDKNDRGEWSASNNTADSNVLCWLVDTAKGKDRNAETLAHVEVLLALASVHTTLLRMVNVLYDITANPEYISELREEIQETVNAGTGDWTYSSYARLEKLDSVMRESQRMSPPTILGLKRLFKESFTFDNGTCLPKGSYATLPIYAIENDPSITPNPAVFDGLRSYRLRRRRNQDRARDQATTRDAAKIDEHLFSSIEPTVLHFGYGKTACPGRYFASVVIKMVSVKLLCDFEFRFKERQGRPQNLLAHEFLFCWPWQWMDIRKKEESGCPF